MSIWANSQKQYSYCPASIHKASGSPHYSEVLKKEYQKIIDKIQNGYAPESIYNKLEQAKTDTEKQEIVYK